jgi:hypothetical protein
MSARRSAPDYGTHFNNLAARYDELRPDPSCELIETLVRDVLELVVVTARR